MCILYLLTAKTDRAVYTRQMTSSMNMKQLRQLIADSGGWKALGLQAKDYKSKKSLLQLVEEKGLLNGVDDDYGKKIRENNAALYSLAKGVVEKLPDMRIDVPSAPQFQEQTEQWNCWKFLYREIHDSWLLQEKQPKMARLFSLIQQSTTLTSWHLRNLRQEFHTFADGFPILCCVFADSNKNMKALLLIEGISWPLGVLEGPHKFTKAQKKAIRVSVNSETRAAAYLLYVDGEIPEPTAATSHDSTIALKKYFKMFETGSLWSERQEKAQFRKNMMHAQLDWRYGMWTSDIMEKAIPEDPGNWTEGARKNTEKYFQALSLLLREGQIPQETLLFVLDCPEYRSQERSWFVDLNYHADDFTLLVREIFKLNDLQTAELYLQPVRRHQDFSKTVKKVLCSYTPITLEKISWALEKKLVDADGLVTKMLSNDYVERARRCLSFASLRDRLCFALYTKENLESILTSESDALANAINHNVLKLAVRRSPEYIDRLVELNPNIINTSINQLFFSAMPASTLRLLFDEGFGVSQAPTYNMSLLLKAENLETMQLLLEEEVDDREVHYILENAAELKVPAAKLELLLKYSQ